MSNRASAKSNIVTKCVPTVSNAGMIDMLNNEIADNVKFREDVVAVQNSTSSSITVNFTGKDRIDLTRTGGALNITVTGLADGETKSLLITKTAGQAISFVGVNDITANIIYVTEFKTTVFYEITRKGTNFFAISFTDSAAAAIPRGLIMFWDFANGAVPGGWVLCDGNNGTRDMRRLFVVGYDNRTADEYATTGGLLGEDTHVLTEAELAAHNHSVYINRVEIDLSHNHAYKKTSVNVATTVPLSGGNDATLHPVISSTQTDDITTTSVINANHNHVVDQNTVGSNTAHENRPRSIVMAYIMKK